MKKSSLLLILAVLLSASMAFATGTQSTTTQPTSSSQQSDQMGDYHQSAYLNGKGLPPVDQRVPNEPLVVAPGTYGMTEIGQFGGIYAGVAPDAPNAQGMTDMSLPFWGDAKVERPTVLPLAYKSMEASNGNRTFTLRLREGAKWSDGSPYTARDLQFWFEDFALNPELTPAIPGWLTQGEQIATLTVIDDYTVRMDFPNPYPGFDVAFGSRVERQATELPFTYLSQFHKSYATATELASRISAGGFEEWTQLFAFHRDHYGQYNKDRPSMMPWTANSGIEATPITWVRNPYFWMVDSAGNQLPYMDEQHIQIVPDAAAQSLRALAGEVTVANIPASDVELAQQAATAGKIQMVTVPFPGDLANNSITFNWFTPDPFKRQMFRDVRFRQAISYWAPREEINQLIFEGLAPIRQTGVNDPSSAWYVPELNNLAKNRDIAKANALLDEMGLTRKNADGIRLDANGRPITLTIFSIGGWFDDTWTLMIEELPKIGLQGNFRGVGWGAQTDVLNAMDFEVMGWQSFTGYANRDWPSAFGGGTQTLHPSNAWSRPWFQWLTSGGSQGEEPPAFAKEMWRLSEAAKSAESDAQLTQLIVALQKLQAQHLIGIELIGFTPRFRALQADVGNPQGEWFIQNKAIYFHKSAAQRAMTQ